MSEETVIFNASPTLPRVRLVAAMAAMMLAMPVSERRDKRQRATAGTSTAKNSRNKYRLCHCGSFKPWANCCGEK